MITLVNQATGVTVVVDEATAATLPANYTQVAEERAPADGSNAPKTEKRTRQRKQ